MAALPTLLLVDDSPDILAALELLLREEGRRILAAGSAEEGFCLLARNAVDVVISDLRLGPDCGIGFLEQVRQRHPGTVRMLLSGDAAPPTAGDAIRGGAVHGYLTKPWNNTELRATVRAAFLHGPAPAGEAGKAVRILLVEDSEDAAAIAIRALRRGGFEPQYERVESAAALRAALARERWDAIISDFNLPEFSGPDALGILRASGLDIPFILVSGSIGEETAAQAMKAGANDYVMKDNLARLAPALERELKEADARAAHRRAQRELIEGEARFRKLAELSSDWYWEQDADFRFTVMSGGVLNKGNFAAGKALGKTRWELPIEPGERDWAAHRATLAAHRAFTDFEYRIVTDDGSVRQYSVRGEPVFDDQGRFAGYRGTGNDVTERKRTQEALAQFKRTLDQTLDCVFMFREDDFRFIYVNEGARRQVGYSEAEMLQMTPLDLKPAFTLERFRQLVQPLRDGSQASLTFETLHRRKDGRDFPVEIVLQLLRNEGQEPRFVAIVRDISERKRADRLLRLITEGTASTTGAAFMHTLTRTLGEALGVRYAFVGEFAGAGRDRVKVISLWNGLEHAEPFEYPVEGTPCRIAIQEAECYYPSGVQSLFPQDEDLVRLGVDCYLGIRLQSSKGEPLGLLTVMHTRQLGNEALTHSVMRIFAGRASAELERMQSTAALARSERRFSKTFRASPLAAVLTRLADGDVLDVNDACCELLGHARQEMLGRTTRELGFWAVASDRERAMEELRRTGTVRGFEHAIRRKSGEKRIVQIWLEPIELDGEPCIVGSLLDVTERKEAERKRRKRSAQLRLLTENIPAAIAYVDRELVIQEANQRYVELHCGGGVEVIGRPLREVVGEKAWPEVAKRNADVLAGKQVVYERTHERADGERREIEVHLDPDRSPGGEVRGYYAFILDITERKRAEDDLRRFRLALDHSADMIFLIDRTTMRYVDVNETACRLLGYSREEICGMGPQDVLPASREDLERAYDELIANPSLAGSMRSHYRCKDGSSLPFESTRHVLRTGEGYLIAAISRDIRASLAAEQRVRDSEERFRSLTELSSDWYWEQDENFRFVDMSDAPSGSSPLRAGGYAGKARWEAYADALPAEQWAAHRRQVENHETFRDLEFARPSRVGEMRWVSISGGPVFDREGRFKGYRGVGRDITSQKLAAQALLLRDRALEASVNAIMITDVSHNDNLIVYVNPAFERNTGYAPAEVLGRNPRFLLGSDTDQPGLEALRAARSEVREGTALLRNYRKDGTMFWNELRIAPVRDPQGRVTHFVGVQNDVTERIGYQAELEHQANFDSLTGLANRNLLADRLRQTIVRTERAGRLGAVLFLDLDRFKVINDSLGHAMGDRVLAQVGWRLSEAVRGDDTVARTGGDEFVVVLADMAREEDVAVIAQKLLGIVAEPVRIDGHEFLIGTSIGAAVFPRDGSDPETLLKHADSALYRAKDSGRGGVAFFAQEMTSRALTYFNLERDLRRALERGEFLLHYQPVIAMASGEIVGAEALLRWRRESGQMVAPADFIPIAEESGLIVPIGAWVLKEAATRAREWNADGSRRLGVAVNLSARQFRDPKLVDFVRDALAETGLEPQLLNLEITESTVMHNAEEAIAALRALREIGVRLSVDDFGTGYSSLSYLKRLPLDYLKVDRSFIKDIPGNRDDMAITHAVVELAHSLELKVVAEGVETESQRAFLLGQGCDFAQGYLFSRPVDPDAFRALLTARVSEAAAAQSA